jgi:hypothetical protein
MKTNYFFRRLSLLIGFFFLMGYSVFACNYTISLTDSYGDGWNGGKVTVKVNGVVVINQLTLSSGSGPLDSSFTVNTGDTISTVYVAGSWSSENKYEIKDAVGNVVATQGASGTPGNISGLIAACPAALDAGMVAIVVPSVSGSQTVKAVIKNFGTNNLTTATINWAINGVAQTAVSFSGSLATNATDTVTLGTYTFSVGVDTISAYTVSPNGGTDANASNDTVVSYITFYGTISSFPFYEDFSISNTYFPLTHGAESNATVSSTFGNPAPGILLTGKTYNGWSSYGTVTAAFGNTSHVAKATATVDASSLSYLKLEFDMRMTYTYNANYGWTRVMINGTTYAKDLAGDSVWQANTANSDPFQTLVFDLSAYAGTSFTLSIEHASKYDAASYGNSYGDDLYIDNIKLYEPPANELAMYALYLPKSGIEMYDTMDVAAVVYNNGVAPQSNYDVSYSLNGGTSFVSQTVSDTIAPGAYDTIFFSTKADFSTVGINNVILAVNNTGDQNAANDTITATVKNIGLPYDEGFESYALYSTPDYWTVINNTGSSSPYVKTYGSAHTGSRCLKMYNYNKTSGDLIAVLPALYSGVANKVMKFWVDGYNSGDLYIGVMTDPNDASTFAVYDTIAVPDSYAKFSVNFSNYSGTGMYIAFKHAMSATYKSIYIDDIHLYEPLANDMMMLSWDSPRGGIAMDTMDIKVSVYNNGFMAQDTIPVAYSIDAGTTIVWDTIFTTINPEDTFQFTFSTPAAISTGLNECGAVVSNNDLNPVNDTVFYDLNNYAMPYVNTFENETSGQLPTDWSMINTTGTNYVQVVAFNYSNYAHSGSFSLKIYNYNKTSGDLIAVMPGYFGDSLTDKRVSFWLRGHSTASIIVGVLDDPTDASTFTVVDTIHPVNGVYNRYAVSFDNYSGSGKYIGFKHGMEASWRQLFIDDLRFEVTPQGPLYSVLPDSNYVFTSVRYNYPDTVEQVFTVSNDGVGQMNVTATLLTGVNDTNFILIDTNTYPKVLGMFESLQFKVRFFGDSIGTRHAQINVTHDAITDSIMLQGDVVDPIISSFPYVENFDDQAMDLGWKTEGNLYKWFIHTAGTPSSSTGPLHDLSGNGYYIYTEASSGATGDEATILTNPVDMSALTTAKLNYWYHMYGSSIGALYVDIAQSGTWTTVDSLIGQQQTAQADPWMMRSVDLSAYASTLIDSVRFRAVRGSSYAGDISIDDIAFGQDPVVSVNDTSSCDPAITIDAGFTGNYMYEWVDLSTGNVVGTAQTYQVTASGDYSLTVSTDGYFSGTDTFHVDLYNAPTFTVTPDTTICSGDSVSLTAMVQGVSAGGVFFSEYIEGSSNNKALEIYNGTGATINLDDYTILSNYNGNSPWTGQYHFPAGATLAAGDVFVIANENADSIILSVADDTLAYNEGGYVVGFNGDDVRALFHYTSTTDSVMIDIIGANDLSDPGSGWDVAGVATATANHTLVRKPTVISGDTSWVAIAGTDSVSSQYLVYPKNDFSHLGAHTVSGIITYTYSWSTGETTSTITVAPTMNTTYFVTVDNGHCQVMDSVAVTVIPTPVVNLGNDTTIKWSWSLTLDAGNPNATWLWNTGATTQTETFDSLNLTNGTANTVWVEVTENGCSASDTLIITVLDDVSINGAMNDLNMKVYPNPTDGRFNMVLSGYNGTIQMDIVDIAGQIVHSEEITVNGSLSRQFELNNLSNGVYYIKLSSKDGVKVMRLIIQ